MQKRANEFYEKGEVVLSKKGEVVLCEKGEVVQCGKVLCEKGVAVLCGMDEVAQYVEFVSASYKSPISVKMLGGRWSDRGHSV
jgi:hypothetical protein